MENIKRFIKPPIDKQKIKNNRLLADLITERNVNSLIDDNDLKSKCKDVKKLQDSNYI